MSDGLWQTARWHEVDRASGDLLYVGSSDNLYKRLAPRQRHNMWKMVLPREEPHVFIAIWFYRDYDIRLVERSMMTTCQPRWGALDSRIIPWEWRQPDELVDAYTLRCRFNSRAWLDKVCGVYAWLYLPRGADVKTVMMDSKRSR